MSPCRKVVETDPSAEVTRRLPLSSRTANPDEPGAGGRPLASRPVAPVVKASRLRLASSRTLRYSCEKKHSKMTLDRSFFQPFHMRESKAKLIQVW